jgi:hypothetical protein
MSWVIGFFCGALCCANAAALPSHSTTTSAIEVRKGGR